MRSLIICLLSLSLLFCISCDDGDIITVEFDFENTFSTCGDLVFYKTKQEPTESMSISFSNLKLGDLLVVEDNDSLVKFTTGVFNYRTYSNEKLPSTGLFCSDIPNSDVDIIEDYEAKTSNTTIISVLTEDDNDGIPAALEDTNQNGNLKDDDTDGDGLWNYIDADDDGDNVLTKDEKPEGDSSLDGLLNLDTDKDGIPNYLDDDDDGDGVKTRDEENDTQDQNPTNDTTDPDAGDDYLNAEVKSSVSATAYRSHTITKSYKISVYIDISVRIISQENYYFGTLENGSSLGETRTETPDFN
jgi:hypothetical protein